jgi:hypothetical protein
MVSNHVKDFVGGEVHGFESPGLHKILYKPLANMGCHVAAHDWATWHLYIPTKHATCQLMIRPRPTVLPHQLATSICSYCLVTLPRHSPYCPVILATSAADVTHATCHPFSGDTCHLGIGPTIRPNVQICLPHVITRGCHMSPVQTCHVSLYGPATSVYGHATSASVRTVWTAQSTIFFACLTFRTECDIFSIRTPFDKVNIPPESGRRDGRNGVVFIRFRALSFLSIFQALSGFWIRFRITPPHNKTFWSPKGY